MYMAGESAGQYIVNTNNFRDGLTLQRLWRAA